MIKYENDLLEIKKYEKIIDELEIKLKIEEKRNKILEIEKEVEKDGFWNDVNNSQKMMQQLKELKGVVTNYNKLEEELIETIELFEMSLEEEDKETIKECLSMHKQFLKKYEKIEMESTFTGKYDKNNCIITLHAGAGGTESCDWVSMLLRMYTRFIEKNNMKKEIIDYLSGEEAGIKSVSFEVTGENCYGLLKSEKGVHRLVRISPFDTAGKRHTSFAGCEVLPVIDEDMTIEIKTEELKIDTYRASGAGGQHINTTDSAIRITHLPTNTVVQCQSQRSQIKNKEQGLKMLKAKLFELKEKENIEKISGIRGNVGSNGFGSQIRSYVMHPYSMVKDHRTNYEIGNVQSVLDGDIGEFISEYLKNVKE